jgi:hypothetical protein
MSKKVNLEQVKIGIIFIVGAAVWIYILRCVFDDTPFLQWLDDEHPVLFMLLSMVTILSPLWICERIDARIGRAANGK